MPGQPGRSVVSDPDELRTLLQRYARAADDRDIDVLTALFHPDAMVDGARGKQSIAEWLEGMRAPRTFPASMHVLGDRDAGQSDLTLGIRYLDDMVRHDGNWVIRNRVAKNLWMR